MHNAHETYQVHMDLFPVTLLTQIKAKSHCCQQKDKCNLLWI